LAVEVAGAFLPMGAEDRLVPLVGNIGVETSVTNMINVA